MLKIRHPVILGGMAGATNPELVAAVSGAGGLGIHGVSMITHDAIRQDTARIHALTSQPFGLNLLLFATDDARLDAVLAERPLVASFGWANADQPLDAIFARAHAAGSLVMHMVSTVYEAVRAAEAGADIIVAQGSEGGGHVGVMGTMVLVPQVVSAVRPKPVLAAGRHRGRPGARRRAGARRGRRARRHTVSGDARGPHSSELQTGHRRQRRPRHRLD